MPVTASSNSLTGGVELLINGKPFPGTVHDVKTFGAKGDGVTDDTAAINAAYTALGADGGVVRIPPGTYMISSSILPTSNTWTIGAGMGVSVIKTMPLNYSAMAKASSMLNRNWASHGEDNTPVDLNINVCDLTIDGNRANLLAPANEQEGIDWVNVTNSQILRVELINVHSDSIDLDACSQVLIDGCRIYNSWWDGIHAGRTNTYGNSDVHVRNCWVELCAEGRKAYGDGFHAGIHNDSSNGSIVNNTVINCWQGILTGTDSQNINVSGNVVIGTKVDWDIVASGRSTRVSDNYCEMSATSSGNLLLSGSSAVTVSNNVFGHGTQNIKCSATYPCAISNNSLRGAAYLYPIEVSGAAHVISSNIIESRPSNAARGAINVASTAARARICNNVLNGSQAGMSVSSAAAGVLIDGNSCNGATATYITVSAADNIVANNSGSGATTAALTLTSASSYALVTGNNFRGSTAAASIAGTGHAYGTNVPTIS